jgi:hypothetical protein
VALVIGNNAYEKVPQLQKAVNGAADPNGVPEGARHEVANADLQRGEIAGDSLPLEAEAWRAVFLLSQKRHTNTFTLRITLAEPSLNPRPR